MSNFCWLHITSGQGPEECTFFVYKLTNKIIEDANSQGLSAELINFESSSNKNCYLSSLIKIEGSHYKDFVEELEGTHQWIVQSPFRPTHRRKNWYIGVNIIKVTKDTEEINHKDIEFQYFHSSGPGGQNINKVCTGVRATHTKLNIIVSAQEERSQYMNKKLALAKLLQIINNKDKLTNQQKNQDIWHQHYELERGNPIRIYKGIDFERVTDD